jgi:hypothetical protein
MDRSRTIRVLGVEASMNPVAAFAADIPVKPGLDDAWIENLTYCPDPGIKGKVGLAIVYDYLFQHEPVIRNILTYPRHTLLTQDQIAFARHEVIHALNEHAYSQV